ncbi:metal ABC transporter permease [Ideonella livida]|uniref:Metal ABC transporter permease n=1 Tax=Ideonella livida TaxID=2707176 RepID=A0A7C9TM34_9BURK|nr:metal ABC transporter permease [Ideonella livida]NDY93980.1 metal ABC transporter permease [Ideonella livida]
MSAVTAAATPWLTQALDAWVDLGAALWFLAPVLALAAGLLALGPLGAQVLRRGVVFIDLAVAQAAAAAALAVTALAHHPGTLVTQAAAVAGALVAAAGVAALSRAWPAHREALIGLVYVACACLGLLLARLDAHGAEHLHALLAADLLWAGWGQAAGLAVAAAGVALLGGRLAQDRWFYLGFATVAALAVQVLGLFIVFAALIAPGLWHRAGLPLARALGLALAAGLAGLGASWWWDAPSGPLVALALAAAGVASVGRAGRGLAGKGCGQP